MKLTLIYCILLLTFNCIGQTYKTTQLDFLNCTINETKYFNDTVNFLKFKKLLNNYYFICFGDFYRSINEKYF